MTPREKAARALAFFERTDDVALLHRLIADVAPRAKRMVGRYLARGPEETIPPPADIRPARDAASKDEAVATVNGCEDFGLLQALARSIGQRIEAIEIAASAEFPEGTRVRVPEKGAYPPAGRRLDGTVEQTGMELQVLLDNGETWRGPATLAQLVRPA